MSVHNDKRWDRTWEIEGNSGMFLEHVKTILDTKCQHVTSGMENVNIGLGDFYLHSARGISR